MADYILYDGKYSGKQIDAFLSRVERTSGNGALQPEIAGVKAVELAYGQYTTVTKQLESDGSISLVFGVPRGKDGAPGTAVAKGATFIPSVSDTGDLSWTNDADLPNPKTVNITGPKGDPGIVANINGMFALTVDEYGNLWVWYNDSGTAPQFELDEYGNLYYVFQDVS